MGGVVMMLSGAAVYYHTQLQLTITLSSTKAEFVNMTDARKAALYLRWILEEIGLIQTDATPICANNLDAIHMSNVQKPTRRTCHVEMKHFVILQWTDVEFINFVKTKTQNQATDSLSKPKDRTKFYEHMDVLMGQRKPKFTGEPNGEPNGAPNNKSTTTVHYIKRKGGDVKTSPYINSLYNLTNNTHKFSHNNYYLYDHGKKH